MATQEFVSPRKVVKSQKWASRRANMKPWIIKLSVGVILIVAAFNSIYRGVYGLVTDYPSTSAKVLTAFCIVILALALGFADKE